MLSNATANVVFLDSSTIPLPVPRPAAGVNWTDLPATLDNQVIDALRDADVALTNKVRLTRDVLRELPRLKFICVTAAGYDCVDVDYCAANGIQISNVPGYAARSVAEHVMACVFALRRKLVQYRGIATGHAWSNSSVFCVHGPRIGDIAGTTIGLVGYGSIAAEVARLSLAVGMQVLRSERKGAGTVRPGYVAFDEALRRSDVVSLHCPLTSTTEGMMGEREFSMMKPSAVLVNTARGALIDERALEHALTMESIAGAALDVLRMEPPHEGNRFLTRELDNLILTPHIAWASTSGVDALVSVVARNVESYLAGKPENRIC
jgi:glycerate dehydrogenase